MHQLEPVKLSSPNGKAATNKKDRTKTEDVSKQDPTISNSGVEITLRMQVEEETDLISFNNVPILSAGNISMLTSRPGVGKSQVCEILDSAFLNPFCDSMGFKIELPPNKIMLHIDTERTANDCIRGLKRVARRVEAQYNEL